MKFTCLKCNRYQERHERAKKCDAPNCAGELRRAEESSLRGVSFMSLVNFPAEHLALLNAEQISALFDGIAKVKAAENAWRVESEAPR